jgi:polyferredoxin
MLYTLLTRSPIDLAVIHDRNPLFVMLSDGDIRNGYMISIVNKHHEDEVYRLEIDGLEKQALRIQGNADISADNLRVFADSVGHFRVFVTAPKQHETRKTIGFIIAEQATGLRDRKETIFMSDNQ